MKYDLSFSISDKEACPRLGLYFAKTYVAVPSAQPESRTIGLGKREPDMSKIGSLTAIIFNKLAVKERPRVIGYSILKLCAAHDPILLERVGNYAFVKPEAAAYDVEAISEVTDEGICDATIFQGAGKVLNCVDMPHTSKEAVLQGTQVAEAVSSTMLHKANIVLRPNVHIVTAKDLAQ